jgi:hypothetical protein
MDTTATLSTAHALGESWTRSELINHLQCWSSSWMSANDLEDISFLFQVAETKRFRRCKASSTYAQDCVKLVISAHRFGDTRRALCGWRARGTSLRLPWPLSSARVLLRWRLRLRLQVAVCSACSNHTLDRRHGWSRPCHSGQLWQSPRRGQCASLPAAHEACGFRRRRFRRLAVELALPT